MQRRSLRITLEIAAGILAGLAILIGIGFWRLSAGPISLSFLTPAVQSALNQIDGPFDIEVEDTVLSWGGWDRAVDILIKNVTLRQNGNQPLAVLPELSIGLSIEALGRGLIAPTSLEVFSPEIRVRRYADGRFSFGIQGQENEEEVEVEDAPLSLALIDALMRPPDPESRLAYLTRVSVIGASTVVSDRLAGVTWRMPNTNVVMVRDGNELRGNANATLAVRDIETKLSAVFLRSLDTESMTITLSVNEFDPELVARAVPQAAFLKDIKTELSGSLGVKLYLDGTPREAQLNLRADFGRLDVDLGVTEDGNMLDAELRLFDVDTQRLASVSPDLGELTRLTTKLSGEAKVAATLDGEILGIDFAVRGNAGSVDVSELNIQPVDFRSLNIVGRADAALESLILEEARIDILDDTSFSARGAAVRDGDGYAIDLAADLTNVPADRLGELWPEDMADGAREWVIPNIPKAFVPRASAELRGRIPIDDPEALEIDRFGGSMEIEDATVHYFRPLEPVVGVSGTAEFGLDFFKIRSQGGTVGENIKVGRGIIDLTELDSFENASISVALETPITDALLLLDQQPLGLISKLDIAPTDISGEGVAEASFKFRLLSDLKADDVIYAARADLQNVSMKNAPLGTTITDGILELKLDTSGMDVDGSAAMNGEPIVLEWRENFQDSTNLRSMYEVSGKIDDTFLRGIGIDFHPYWHGGADIDLIYRSFRDQPARLGIVADIAESWMGAEFLDWEKRIDDKGTLSFEMVFAEEGGATIEDIVVTAGSLAGRGDVRLGTDFTTIEAVNIADLSYDGNDFSGTVNRRVDGGLSIDVRGNRFDIEHFIAGDEGLKEEEVDEEDAPLPFDLKAQFNEVVAGAQRRLQTVDFDMIDNGDEILRLILHSEVSPQIPFDIELERAGDGQTLSVTSSNAGVALEALDWTSRISGGALSVTASRPTLDAPFDGDVQISDFTLVNAPVVAKLLEFMSLTGILSALSDSGLEFSEFTTDFTFDDGFLTFSDARAYGTSVGITADGFLDTEAEFVEIEGTVVPAYTVNRVLGAIPILGPLVVGGEGEGLFAANYKVDGPIEDPAVAVNPLSALAPSFLRRLFKADTDAGQSPEDIRQEDGTDQTR